MRYPTFPSLGSSPYGFSGNVFWMVVLLLVLVIPRVVGAMATAVPDIAALRTQAEQGDPVALNALGAAYVNGRGVAQNYAEAVRLYSLSADKGSAVAQFNLGTMAEAGQGQPIDLAAAL